MKKLHTTKARNFRIMTSNQIKNTFRIILGGFLFFAGVSHLTFLRAEFQAQVPDWVPVSKDLTVILSGIVEVLLGLALFS